MTKRRAEKRRYPADDTPRPQPKRSGCPTPTKTAYPTRAAALGPQLNLAKHVGTARAYQCPCGSWHLTKMHRATG